MRIVCVSDTHGAHELLELPEGDVLVHAGDVTAHGDERELLVFLEWFSAQQHAHKVFVAGNHDLWMEAEPDQARQHCEAAGVHWLNDSGVSIDGVQLWGSPITPRFLDWAFMRNPGADIEKHWAEIPRNTSVLITHGPPFGILDVVKRSHDVHEHTGCPSLLRRTAELQALLHVFGHIHEGYGLIEQAGITYCNASSMNERYRMQNAPVVFNLELDTRSLECLNPEFAGI